MNKDNKDTGRSCRFFRNSIIVSYNMWLAVRRTDNGWSIQSFSKKAKDYFGSAACFTDFFVVEILQMGGGLPLWFSEGTTKTIGIVMAVYLSLNVVMNSISKSKKERYIMTPLF